MHNVDPPSWPSLQLPTACPAHFVYASSRLPFMAALFKYFQGDYQIALWREEDPAARERTRGEGRWRRARRKSGRNIERRRAEEERREFRGREEQIKTSGCLFAFMKKEEFQISLFVHSVIEI